MSTFKNPVGPQSSKVYWRRRLLVGLGVLAAVIIIFLIFVRPGGRTSKAIDKSGSPTSTAVASTAATTKPAAGAACLPANVSVTAITDKGIYNTGEQPLISMSVTNTGSAACTINAGSTQQVLQITSGTDVIWTSTDCQTGPVDAPVTLEPNKAQATTPIPWDRTRSSKTTCTSTTRPAVPAAGASYHLTVKLGSIAAAKTKQFILK
jgi:hypothetical protein